MGYVLAGLFGGGGMGAIVLALKAWPEIRQLRSNTGKTDVEASKVIADTALALLAPLRTELKAAHEEVAALRDEVAVVRAENAAYRQTYGPLGAN